MLIMPGYVKEEGALATKILSMYHGNAALNLPTHSAIVILMDSRTGLPLGVCYVKLQYINQINMLFLVWIVYFLYFKRFII